MDLPVWDACQKEMEALSYLGLWPFACLSLGSVCECGFAGGSGGGVWMGNSCSKQGRWWVRKKLLLVIYESFTPVGVMFLFF